MLLKCCTQYVSKSGRPSSDHRTGKGQSSSQFPSRVVLKNSRTIALISHASKVMLKILHARLQNYMKHELPDVQAGFRKDRGTRDQVANICWIIENSREFLKNTYLCFTDYAIAFDCVDHNKLWESTQRYGNTRPSYPSSEKPVCGSRSNNQNPVWNN